MLQQAVEWKDRRQGARLSGFPAYLLGQLHADSSPCRTCIILQMDLMQRWWPIKEGISFLWFCMALVIVRFCAGDIRKSAMQIALISTGADAEPEDVKEILKSSAMVLASVRVQAGAIVQPSQGGLCIDRLAAISSETTGHRNTVVQMRLDAHRIICSYLNETCIH